MNRGAPASSCLSAVKGIAVRGSSPVPHRGRFPELQPRSYPGEAEPRPGNSAPAGRGKLSLDSAPEAPGVARAEIWSPALRGTNRGHSGCWVQSPVAGSKHILGLYQVHLKTASEVAGFGSDFVLPAVLLGTAFQPFFWSGAAEVRTGQGSAAVISCRVLTHRKKCLYRIQLKLWVCREAKHKFSSAKALEQENTQVACMARMEGMFHVQLFTDAFLPAPWSKMLQQRTYKAQRCESCSRVLGPCVQVSRDTQLWSQFCCAGWSEPPIICVSKVGTAVFRDPWMKIITQYQILCTSISPSDFYSSQCSI